LTNRAKIGILAQALTGVAIRRRTLAHAHGKRGIITMSESPEQVKRRLEMRGFSRDQVAEMQKLASAMAQQQMKNTVQATTNFISTVVTLLSSAVGFVAAFAWNDAISHWIPTVPLLSTQSDVDKRFIYALFATLFAVVVIAVLGIVNGRIKGRSLIPTQNSPF
jgi:hypothetical protein